MRILLAEDDSYLSDAISLALSDSGYAVDRVASGDAADQAAKSSAYDLLVLDLGLPGMDGLEVLKRLRGRGQALPVLILTARDSLQDRVGGLDLGANDYMTKPFELPELEARVRALLRKDLWANRRIVKHGSLEFDTVERHLTLNGELLELSARELAALEILLQRAGMVVTKAQLAEHLSSWESEITHNAIEIIIHRLRKKLENSDISLRTIRGLGYLVDKAK
ncbi:MAG: response regulator transcription factor [Candidatus Obscuribacterales bacterium]|nr:response regulator transcription factor [Candidatus Obscuribacterales bacterium]